MSAIYGIFERDRAPATGATLEAMAAAMACWGPDGGSAHHAGSAALGHLMLHTTPESLHERLPAAHPDRPDLLITADARLDNRAALLAALSIADSGIADSMLILHAYTRWGEECVARLLGDFAFAIWDGQRQAMFCARDHMGVKPFYYHLAPRLFAFASDQRGLLAHPAVPRRLNEPLLALYLQDFTFFAEKRQTYFQDIVKLPPAHWLLVSAAGVRLHEYWSADNLPAIKLPTDRDYEERLRELLAEAVACRLRSAFPVGAHLSGGLDSTSVAVLAARGLRERGAALAGGFSWSPPPADGAADDERRTIAEICALEGINCHYVEWGVEHGVEAFGRDFTVQPREMLLRELKVQQAAQERGIRVLLSGWGGDDAISYAGRGYQAELLRTGRWRTWRREVVADGNHSPRRYLAALYHQSFALVPDPLWPLVRPLAGTPRPDRRHMNPAFARRYRREVAALRSPSLRDRPSLHEMQRRLLQNGHLTARLESWAISGAQHVLEYRYPLLDRRILEFALGVPNDQLYRDGFSRYLFRRALGGILPDHLRWRRSKTEPGAFNVVLNVLPDVLTALLEQYGSAAAQLRVAPYVDVAGVVRAVQQHSAMSREWILLERALSCLQIQYLPEPGTTYLRGGTYVS